MCTIRKDTIIRANERLIGKGYSGNDSARNTPDEITVSTRYMGKEYSQTITVNQLCVNYGKALNASSR